MPFEKQSQPSYCRDVTVIDSALVGGVTEYPPELKKATCILVWNARSKGKTLVTSGVCPWGLWMLKTDTLERQRNCVCREGELKVVLPLLQARIEFT